MKTLKNTIKTAEILCVGTEILIGDIVNTNAAFISKRLADLGFSQYYQSVVGDNPERLKNTIHTSLDRCDLLIMTGGLGPTYDDLTKECAAEALEKKLYLHEESLERMKRFFTNRNQKMPETNIKQAMMPEDSVVFKNDNGTAPGVAIIDEQRNKIIVMLPGPPRELIPMFENEVMPFLRQFSDHMLISKNVNITGMGESAVEIVLRDQMKNAINPTIAPYCKEGEVRLRVTASASNDEEGAVMCDKEIEKIRQTEIGKFIYGIDTDLEHAVVEGLRAKGKTLSLAESCTGGLISKRITDIAGCSDVYAGGCVTYSNQLKNKLIGVKTETLEKFGAVSEECAREMAEGVRLTCGSSIGAAVTGVAGPCGGTPEKPVGLVWCAVSIGDGLTVTKKLTLSGSRDHIRILSANAVMALILQNLE